MDIWVLGFETQRKVNIWNYCVQDVVIFAVFSVNWLKQLNEFHLSYKMLNIMIALANIA